MKNNMKKEKQWEIDFNEKFCYENGILKNGFAMDGSEIKQFFRQEIASIKKAVVGEEFITEIPNLRAEGINFKRQQVIEVLKRWE